ncbi:hypothetical protein A2477_04080 [Candidatus Falkowbacteria bacterium RIFOXYC2_FULL_47_12]|uniref:EamA domain-containing protein n=1 Tax=Candidatus Falkowbacteria bacterium RIFOXYC2_FULL_47_12 TaxID=1798004 RepID=A0A1F5TPE6_9BACT|nr:MAG: hypothetical protein A2477_04080 [Candidatus Falkowbacteria bacterium RIFOXYC2_FULL_47_12]
MWLFYSILSAVAVGITDIAQKMLLHELPLLPTIAVIEFFTLLVLVPFFIRAARTEKKLIPNRLALRAFVAAAFFDAVMFWMFSLALKWGPISVVSPLRNTVPLFSLLLGWHLLRERTGVWEKAGIVLSVVSLAFLIGSANPFAFSPQVAAALLLALGVAVLSAATLIANKYATSKQYGGMNVIVFITLDHLVAAIAYTVAVFISGATFPPALFSVHSPIFYVALGIGVLFALASWGIITACSIGDTVRISPVARLSVLVSVIIGGAWFVEANLALRIVSTVFFLIGLTPVMVWQEKIKEKI